MKSISRCMALILALFLFFATPTATYSQDTQETANALFVEAVLLYRKSRSADEETAKQMRQEVKQKFDRILVEFPDSRPANEIRSGRPAGINLATLPEASVASIGSAVGNGGSAQVLDCLENNIAGTAKPPLSMRVELDRTGRQLGIPELQSPEEPDAATRSIYLQFVSALDVCASEMDGFAETEIRTGIDEFGQIFFSLELITEPATQSAEDAPQVTAEKKPDETLQAPLASVAPVETGTEATEAALDLNKSSVRDLQARLLVLGFDPKGVDGQLGRGTRSALSSWQTSVGLKPTGFLSAGQLDILTKQSQNDLNIWLQDAKNAATYDPPIIALGPRNMSGNWRFTSNCGSNSKLGKIKITGTLTIAHAGGNSYAGNARQSQGFKGKFSGTLNDRRISGQINWGLLVGRTQFSGTVADEALVIRGTDTNRCSFYARK